MSNIRLWHSYLGLLSGPSILFFALTGAIQIFDLHESRGAYQPPRLIAELGMVHKKQVFAEPRRRPRPAETPEGTPTPPRVEAPRPWAVLALKWVFLFVALSLAATAGLGIWIGLRAPRYKRLAWVFLAVGAAVPIALVWV